MTRDFLKYLSDEDKKQRYWLAPGSRQYVWRTGAFEGKALDGYNDAVQAISYETDGKSAAADVYWKSIFGSYFPG
jgi:hypothetical protein